MKLPIESISKNWTARHRERWQAKREVARAYRDQRLSENPCVDCGAAVDFHHREPVANPQNRVGQLVGHGRSIARIAAEIALCDPLCRRCHMRRDGRAAALTASRPRKRGDSYPPKPCAECGTPANPLRKGRCEACDARERRRMKRAA